MSRLRSSSKRWTLVAIAGFCAITSIFGNAATAGAREVKPAAPALPADDPGNMQGLGARWCGSSNGSGSWLSPIGLSAKIMKKTGLCKGIQHTDTKVYCNNSSLLSLWNPNIGLGSPNGADAVQNGDPNWGDAGQLVANQLTPGGVKVIMDQLNGDWYDLDRKYYEANESTKWYPDEATNEAVDRGNCELLTHPPSKTCAEIKQLPEDQQNTAKRDGIMPDDCVGTYPSANYNISYDGGGALSVDRKIWGALTGLMFNVGKASIQVSTWSIGKAFSLNLADYTKISTSISKRYNDDIVGPFSLEAFAWLGLMAFVAISALRGKLGLAGGEFAMAMVMLGIAQVLFVNQDTYMDSMSTLINEASNSLFRIAGTGDQKDPGEPPIDQVTPGGQSAREKWWDDALDPLKNRIHVEFVEKPYEYLNWGTVSENIRVSETEEGECFKRVQRVVSIGAVGDDGWSWRYLGEVDDKDPTKKKCDQIVQYNRNPTGARMLGALFTMLIALFVGVTFTLLSLTVMMAKITVAILFAVLPFVVAISAAPGSGRRPFVLLVVSIIQSGGTAVGSSALLAVVVIGDDEILQQTKTDPGVSLMERWTILFILVVFIYYARRKLSQTGQTWAGRTADTITKFAPAAAGWQGDGGGGIDFSSVDRGAQRAGFYARRAGYYGAIAAGSGFVLAGRSVNHRLTERRIARRNLRNLEIMKQRDGDPHLESEIKLPEIKLPDGTKISRTVIQKTRTPHHTEAVRGGGNINFLGRENLRTSARGQSAGHADRMGVGFDRRTGMPRNPQPRPTRPINPRTPAERFRPSRTTRRWFDPRRYSMLPRRPRRWRM
jgi:hypothetical protein